MANTVGQLFLQAHRQFQDRIFADYYERGLRQRMTYSQAMEICARMSAGFRQLGLTHQDKVIWWAEDTLSSALFFLASTMAGIVPVPISPQFSERYVLGLKEQVTAKVIFAHHEMFSSSLSDAIPYPEWLAEIQTMRFFFDDEISRIYAAVDRTKPDDVHVICPTSGSTGVPKLVGRPHGAYVRYSRLSIEHLKLSREKQEGVLAVCALTHSMGGSILVTAIDLAARLCIPSQIDTKANLNEIQALDPSYLPMTPRVLRGLNQEVEFGRPLFGSQAQVVATAGACIEPELIDRVEAEGLKFYQIYGSTEVSMTAIQSPEDRCQMGAAFLHCHNDVQVKLNSDGELLLKSPGHMKGYFVNGDYDRQVDVDGFYLTGDRAELHGKWLRVLGRNGDAFNTMEGSNIFPGRIEAKLENLQGVQQVMLIGDQKPFVSAILVIDDPLHDKQSSDGMIDPKMHAELYQIWKQKIESVNEDLKLEAIERIQAFFLSARDFDPATYSLFNGKVRRQRKEFATRYANWIERLYQRG